jgi:hypothetical protein
VSASSAIPDDSLPDITFRLAWRLDDSIIAQDAAEFWRRLNVLGPQEITRRTSELCTVAYSGEHIVGVATAYLNQFESLKARFAFFRCLVGNQPRREHMVSRLAQLSLEQLESWAMNNKSEQIMGMAEVIPAGELKERQHEPVWPELNLNLVGYMPSGEQIRVSWFSQARLA